MWSFILPDSSYAFVQLCHFYCAPIFHNANFVFLFLKSERSVVSHSHAESLLGRGKHEEAARIYALSNAEFDMVVLRLLGVLSPPTSCSSSEESDNSNTSGLLRSNLRGSPTSIDTDPQCHSFHPPHNVAVSAALLQYLTDKLEQLFPSHTTSSEVTHSVATLYVCISVYPTSFATSIRYALSTHIIALD